ncbi:hypothetical protein [Saccharopolyspora shandongensis]|uniref:hypothetical protein n=1 Tax=Saccharopolyspora shandongensis TaxID=418495 RepID=UPI00340D2540
MTITLRPGSTVLFTGDSITDYQRLESEEGLGFGYADGVHPTPAGHAALAAAWLRLVA